MSDCWYTQNSLYIFLETLLSSSKPLALTTRFLRSL